MELRGQSDVSARSRAEPGTGADALQLTLRFSFRARLTAGVDMTSNVKGCEQIFLGLHDVFFLGASEESEPAIYDG